MFAGAPTAFAENPFASKFVRPGAVTFLDSSGNEADVTGLIDRLAACEWRGAIVGPHGSGKSSLLAAISANLARRGFEVCHATALRTRGGRAVLRLPQLGMSPSKILLVDGFDLLPFWRQWLLRLQCRRKRLGLVVTGHAPLGQVSNLSEFRAAEAPPRERIFDQCELGSPRAVYSPDGRVENLSYRGLPILLYMSPSVLLAERIAGNLAGEAFSEAAKDLVRDSFARHDGNLREVLFDLYDLYERQSRHERI